MSLAEHGSESIDRFAKRRAQFPTVAIREQFGETMLALGREHPQLVAVTADLMYATGIAGFGHAYPERLINVGIAEQNATGVAAGLALCGKLPVVCGYAAFTTLRAVEQAKLDCAYNGVKVILIGQSAGLSYCMGGPTHQTFEDVAIMRAIPNMVVVVPSDAVETDRAVRASVQYPGSSPIYLRLGRGPEHVFNNATYSFEIGKAVTLREGRDFLLVANGPMVFECLLAAKALAEDGVDARVLNVHTVKPIDRMGILAASAGVRGVVVAEEHNVHGGLGSAVLEVFGGGHDFPVRILGIDDAFPPIGPLFELRATLGLSASNIFAVVQSMLASAGRYAPGDGLSLHRQ